MRPVTITADSNHSAVARFRGFSIRESAGTPAAAAVNFRKLTAGGQIIFVLELNGDESSTLILGSDMMIPSEGGVYVEQVSGAVSGVIFQA